LKLRIMQSLCLTNFASSRPRPIVLGAQALLVQAEPRTEEAERCFHTAIEIAQRQGAKSSELRAAASLARMLMRQGRHAEGRTALAAIYGWFTEGFDTGDLKNAKALLQQLGA
jgi:predicted ATPase